MGDFNSDLLINNFDINQIREFIDSSDFFLVPFRATHHTSTSSTLLDLCILNNADKLCGQYPVFFLSAHDLIFVCLQARIARLPGEIVKRCDFCKLHNESFLRDLNNCDWGKFVESNGEDEIVTSLNRNLVSVLHLCEQEVRGFSLLNNYIFQKMKEWDRVRRTWRKHRKPELHKLFKALRNRVQSLIRDAKENYYQNVFSLSETQSPRGAN